MNDAAELLGFWSVEHGFDSAMEDEHLTFRPDGTGWYEYLRPWYSGRTLFHWRPAGTGSIRVEAYRRIVSDEGDGPARLEEHAIDRVEIARYAVTVVRRPSLKQRVRQLSVELSFGSGSPFAFVDAEEPSTGTQPATG